jgi:serine/threonine-protein kinase
MQHGSFHPERLLPGTRVGPWRILDALGSGAHGSVYLAEGVAPEASGRVAVKLAHQSLNARFLREAELLSRIRHPCVPRLMGHGQWTAPGRLPHPWLAMEWVDGIPLYVWAQAFAPSSRQVLRVLAGLARALAATHAVGGVHRDVKGDNALVRVADGQPFLIDFGSCSYPGAAPLTQPVFPPQTQEYRSPEAYHFGLGILTSPVKVYAPKAAEDVFALGVTGYRLVTGEYPPRAEPTDAGYHVWRPGGPGPRPARELNSRCCEELSALISRMLALQPEARGSAAEVAKALEKAARRVGREADAPLFGDGVNVRAEPRRDAPEWLHWSWPPWRVAVSVAAGAASLGVIWMMNELGWVEPAREPVAWQEEAKDSGTVTLGETALTAPLASAHAPSAGTPIALDLPLKPLPRQVRPNAQGRCPFENQVVINGGCWIKVDDDAKACPEYEDAYTYQGACYAPLMKRQPPATSSPPESRDGGY